MAHGFVCTCVASYVCKRIQIHVPYLCSYHKCARNVHTYCDDCRIQTNTAPNTCAHTCVRTPAHPLTMHKYFSKNGMDSNNMQVPINRQVPVARQHDSCKRAGYCHRPQGLWQSYTLLLGIHKTRTYTRTFTTCTRTHTHLPIKKQFQTPTQKHTAPPNTLSKTHSKKNHKEMLRSPWDITFYKTNAKWIPNTHKK